MLVTFPRAQPQGRGCLPIQLGVVGSWTWTQQNPWRPKAWTSGHPFPSFRVSKMLLIRCPWMGKGGPQGGRHCEPLPASTTVLVRDPMREPGRMEGNLVPICWLLGRDGVQCSRGCCAMSNCILAAGSHIPAHGPLAGGTPHPVCSSRYPPRNVAAHGLGLLPAVTEM